MLYRAHVARPADEVFERWKYTTPSFSLRMSKLAAALARPQLGAALKDRCSRRNQRYAWLAAALDGTPHLRLPHRPAKEQYLASSQRFSLVGLTKAQIEQAIAACAERGLHIKWLGADEPVGFTSVWTHWRYFGEPQSLPQAERVLCGRCDLRLSLLLSQDDCAAMGGVVREVLSSVDRGQ